MCFTVANCAKSLQQVYPLHLCVASSRHTIWYTQRTNEAHETHLEYTPGAGHLDARSLDTARFHLVRQRPTGVVVPGPHTPADHPDLTGYRRLPDLSRRKGPQGYQ